eukprot:CAMPEP_0194065802 /NCGR_PEP_ID=MMETSP0009_2-20130614/85672_1 /TAXON_ID=210454 /ORGANISM="Grammatophora oceanica, Strain CCMP 410" /LENGTH=536 /DNA_ID=CAMNT_0038718689 /DNA_START=46 /DNA_END=1656 /DNA_ORIENTATION=-
MRIPLGMLALFGSVSPFQASSTTSTYHDIYPSLEAAVPSSRPARPTHEHIPSIEAPEYPWHIFPYSLQHHGGGSNPRQQKPIGITGRSHSARLPLVRRQHQHNHGELLVRHSYAMRLDGMGYFTSEGYQDGAKGMARWTSMLLRGGSFDRWTRRQSLSAEESNTELVKKILLLTVAAVVGLEISSRIAGPGLGIEGLVGLVGLLLQNTGALVASAAAPLFSVAFWSNLAPMASIALKLSPLPSILRISRERTTGGLPQILLLTVAAVVGLEISSRIAGPGLGIEGLVGLLLQNTGSLVASAAAPLFSVAFWSNLAPMASIALKLSPLPSILRISRERTTGGLPLLPYSAMATMTFSLVIYGLLVGDTRIVGTHGAGHILSLAYCATFGKHYDYGNAPEKKATAGKSSKILSALSGGSEIATHFRWGTGIATALLVAVAVLGREAAAPVAGATSVVLSCLMYTGPLAALKEAIRSRSARNIPLPYAFASIVNAIAWTVYGFFRRHDWMVWAPGLIGIVSAGMQVVVNVCYGSEDKSK